MTDDITSPDDLRGLLPSEIVAAFERLRAERDAAQADAALVREALREVFSEGRYPKGWVVPTLYLWARCVGPSEGWCPEAQALYAVLAAPNPGAALVEAADAMAGGLDELAIHYIGKTGGLDRGDDRQDPVIYMAQRAIDQYRAARSAAGGGEGE